MPCSTWSRSGACARAEVAGLPWTDVDLEAGIARIRQTRPDGDLDPDDPKSEHGNRAVTLDAMTIVALLRGLRRGEAAGLRWCDLDLEHATAMINGQMQRTRGALVAAPPKTRAGLRSIALDHTTVAALRDHRSRQRCACRKC
ncbi:MAG: integrase family protein [Gemmatimonadales bacterium]|nr:integrase family protein [Gemmatimonadales bacterium]